MVRTKKEILHLDIFGREITKKSYVVAWHSGTTHVCSIEKVTPKMIRVKPVIGSYRGGFLTYGNQTVLVDSEDVAILVLKGKQ